MLTTDKAACNILADLLEAHGVKWAVVSPGTRNAPVIVALERRSALRCVTVIDERVAAFTALGIGVQTGAPVALVCTSGSALLNYAPAVAEAYYRKVPLIVVSADRPARWIGQDDSQTIRQPGALAFGVKLTCDIPCGIEGDSEELWHVNRMLNDALLTALSGRRAPVHINLQLDAPLNHDRADYPAGSARVINAVTPREDLPVAEARELGCRLASPRRVLIVAGFSAPDARLNRALGRLAELPNVAVVTEPMANLHGPRFIGCMDAVMSGMSREEQDVLRPDVLITTGGALVSGSLKAWLRRVTPLEHWHVGLTDTTIDCFRQLTLRVEMTPGIFFQQLASAMQPHRAECDYAAAWQHAVSKGLASHDAYVAAAPWSDLKAFATIIPAIPARWNLQLSNGMSVRYAQLMDCSRIHRVDCNRGVSGIDGCTSTATGAALAYTDAPTLLITGDMSAQYDLGALFAAHVPPRFRMIVMANGGGEIFRVISATSKLPELDEHLACKVTVPWCNIAEGMGWDYAEAADDASLAAALPRFMTSDSDRPALLVINTSGEADATILRNYYSRTK